MRHAIIPTLLVLAGVAGAAEPTPLQEFGAGMGDWLNAAARAQDADREAANAALTASDGSPVTRSYRAAAIGAAVDAVNRQEAVRIAPLNDAASIGAGLGATASAAAAEVTAKHHATRILAVVETSGTLARDWQGTSAMISIAGAAGEPTLALGMAVERLSVDDEPVVGAIEGVVRVHVPFAVSDRLAVGPAVAGRIGATFDGGIAVGIDASLHVEAAVAPGIGIVGDIGAGQRATEHAASDIQPTASVGLAFVF